MTTEGRLLERLRALAALPGPSGHEAAVADMIVSNLTPMGLEVSSDGLGNLLARRPQLEGRPRVLIVAHMDEVGLIVRHIDSSGRLWFDPVGWVNLGVLPATPVAVLSAAGLLPGVVLAPSAHLLTVIGGNAESSRLWVDVGARDEADAREMGIAVGDPIVYDSPLRSLHSDRIVGKALDNRVGCAILIELAAFLDSERGELDVQFGFSVQEELGARGAGVLAGRAHPAFAVIVDTVSAADGVAGPPVATAYVGHGPVLRAFDTAPRGGQATAIGAVYSAPLRASISRAAQRLGVAVQHDVATTFTDAAAIQISAAGVPIAGLFVPRYGSHSPNEIVSLHDLEVTLELLCGWLNGLEADDAAQLARPW